MSSSRPTVHLTATSVLPDTDHLVGFQIDDLRMQSLAGTISVRDQTAFSQEYVTLKLGEEVIARALPFSNQPDLARGEQEIPSTRRFLIPFLAGVVYAGLVSRGDVHELSLLCCDTILCGDELAPRLKDVGAFKSLMLHDCLQVRLSDIWFAGGRTLRLRLYVDETGEIDSFNHATLKFYQVDETQQNLCKLICRQPIEKRGISFLTIELMNPLMPILISLSDAAGETIVLDVLPFPSLCRGGQHYAELQAMAWSGRYIDNLRLMNDSLVREIVGWDGLPEDSIIRAVRVDIKSATGTEPVRSPDMRAWIHRVFGTKLIIDDVSTDPAGSDNEPALDTIPDGESVCTLHIPSDAIPSISALSSKRLPSPSHCARNGPFVISDSHEGSPCWLVSTPSFPPWLERVQPKSACRFFPTLTNESCKASEYISEPLMSDIPLAVRFMSSKPISEENRVFPTARDSTERIFAIGPKHSGSHESRLISVIVSIRDGVADCINFCNSLASQTVAGSLELIIIDNRSSKPSREAVRRAAGTLFDDRVRFLDFDAPFNHSAQSNLGAEHARGEILLFANSDVILTDRRIVDALAMLADNEKVASASCTLLHEKSSSPTLRFRSAGVFPVELSLLGRPHLAFAEIDCEAVLPNATYPVVANSFALAAVRKEIWQKIGALDAIRFPTDYNDVDYGLRALEKGYLHLCTSGVAAYHSGRASRGPSSDIHSVRYLTHLPLDRMMQSCTVIRRLRA